MLSETYINNSYHTDDDQLALPGYDLIRADNPSHTKSEVIYNYYRETLPVKVINVNTLSKCLIFDLPFGSLRVCTKSIY